MAIYNEAGNKIGRNSECACGSGKKFKHCHGKIIAQSPSELNGEVALLLGQQLAQAFEDESDISRKHTEFLATHHSGIRIAVEAKSRHRDGVLGYKAPPRRSSQDQLSTVSVEGLIRKALTKNPDAPYFIFIDVNLPYSDGQLSMQPWVKEMTETVDKIYRDWPSGTFPANAIFFCNDPTYQDP